MAPLRHSTERAFLLLILRLTIAIVLGSVTAAMTNPVGSSMTRETFEGLSSLAQEGFRITQRLTRAIGGEGMLLAQVMEEGLSDASRHRARVLLFESQGKWMRLVRSEEFPWAQLVKIDDIDRDGNLELVFQVSTGGNCWTCNYVQIWSVRREGVVSVLSPETFQTVEDLDGDGIVEALALDTRWEDYSGLCHACSPKFERVFRPVQGRWVEASQSYTQHYQKSLDALLERLGREEKESGSSWDDYRMGTLISILLHRIQLGQATEGWREFDARVENWRGSMLSSAPEQRAHLDEVLNRLRIDLAR